VPLTGADIDDPADLSAGGDLVELTVIGLDGVEVAPNRNHAVPGAVRLEIVRLPIGDGMRHLERTEIGDHGDMAVAAHPENAIHGVRHAVRAATAGGDRVERAADERDI